MAVGVMLNAFFESLIPGFGPITWLIIAVGYTLLGWVRYLKPRSAP